MKRKFAIDFGFRYTKVFPGGKLTACRKIPTAIGDATAHNMEISAGHVFENAYGIAGGFSGGVYAVKYGGYPTNRQDRGWFSDPSFFKMFYTVCAEMCVQAGDELDIALCIPINDKESAPAIRQLLEGDHEYTLRGQPPVSFRVTNVFITLQGIAAFFHYALNMNGEPIVNLEEQKTYLLECGGNTLHEVMFDGLVDLTEGTKTHYHMGFWQVINEVYDWLRAEHGITMPLLQVADCVERRSFFLDGNIDLTDIVTDLSMSLAQKHRDLISSHDLRGFQSLQVGGGTGEIFFEEYRKVNPRFELLPFPQFANVIGAYKFALSML
jgi:hypothetical protein